MSKRKKEHHEEHMDETWLIPYADLLTLLLALFIVLFAASQVDSKKFSELMQAVNAAFNGNVGVMNQPGISQFPKPVQQQTTNSRDLEQSGKAEGDGRFEEETKELEAMKESIEKYIADKGMDQQLAVGLDDKQLTITISDTALFGSGSAAVRPEAQKLGMTLADILVQYPGYQILVTGHTDNIPISNREFESNWDLSAKRAINFMKVLQQNKQLEPGRFSAIGQGEFRPVAPNDTKEGREKNRRVELSVLRKTLP